MKKLVQQVWEVIKKFDKWLTVWQSWEKYLFLSWTIYTSAIIKPIVFKIVDTIESQIETKYTQDKKNIIQTISDFPEWSVEINKNSFNEYLLEQEQVSIEWTDYCIWTKRLNDILKLLEDFKYEIYVNGPQLAFYESSTKILLLLTGLSKKQPNLF